MAFAGASFCFNESGQSLQLATPQIVLDRDSTQRRCDCLEALRWQIRKDRANLAFLKAVEGGRFGQGFGERLSDLGVPGGTDNLDRLAKLERSEQADLEGTPSLHGGRPHYSIRLRGQTSESASCSRTGR